MFLRSPASGIFFYKIGFKCEGNKIWHKPYAQSLVFWGAMICADKSGLGMA